MRPLALAVALLAPMTTPNPSTSPQVVLNQLGTNRTWLPANAYDAEVSRDGSLLAYSRSEARNELVLTSPPFRTQRVVAVSTSGFGQPAISTDDRWIAFVGGIVRIDGRRSQKLDVIEPDWSPEDRQLVGVDARGEVAIVDVSGRTTELGPGDAPHWQPHGDLIAYDAPGGLLTVVRADGGGKHVIGRALAGTTTWTNDGARLVFVGASATTPRGTGPLLAWSVRTQRVTRLAFLARGRPVPSPDGRRLLFEGPVDAVSPWRLLTIPLAGGRTRVVGDAWIDPIPRLGWLKSGWIVSIEYH